MTVMVRPPEEVLLGFARALRAAGVAVTADRERTYLEAVAAVGLDDQPAVYFAGRATLCASPADLERYDEMRAVFTDLFASRTQAEWVEIFEGTDACVAGILPISEAFEHPHLKARGTFVEVGGVIQPGPAPRYSNTPTGRPAAPRRKGEDGAAILAELGLSDAEISALSDKGVLR